MDLKRSVVQNLKGIVFFLAATFIYWYLLLRPIVWDSAFLVDAQSGFWNSYPYIYHIVLGVVLFTVSPSSATKSILLITLIPFGARFIYLISPDLQHGIDGEGVGWYFIISTFTGGCLGIGAALAWIIIKRIKVLNLFSLK